jgi:uncharacterized RDD family membrane protein YckC
MNKVLFVAALAIGCGIAYVDSRPNWDDTGVTVAAILVSCGILGAAGPSRPWLWALAVGLWIPLLGIALHRNYGTLLALAFALAGAYTGMAFRHMLLPRKNTNPA